jgi:Phage integrase family
MRPRTERAAERTRPSAACLPGKEGDRQERWGRTTGRVRPGCTGAHPHDSETRHPHDSILVGLPAVGVTIERVVRHFQPAAARAGLLPLRPHHLRHTAVSLLIGQGAHPKKIQEWCGHSSFNVTMDVYGHMLPERHEKLAALLDGVYREKQGRGRCAAPLDAMIGREPLRRVALLSRESKKRLRGQKLSCAMWEGSEGAEALGARRHA